MANILNLVVDFKTLPTTILPNNNYAKKMAIVVNKKDGVTYDKGFKEVFNTTEAGNYTDDVDAVGIAFTNGASSVLLVFSTVLTDYTEINYLAFSLCFASLTLQDAEVTTGYLGVIYKGAVASNNDSKAIASTTNTVCVLEPTKPSELSIAICAKLISGNSWRPITLTQFALYEAVFDTNGANNQAKKDGFTFLLKDDLQVRVPTLWDVFAGGVQAIRLYILENLKIDIQQYIYTVTQNEKFFYTTANLLNLQESVINRIIVELYFNTGLIDFYEFKIPTKNVQSLADINNGIVANVSVRARTNGGINQFIGEVKEVFLN